MKIAFCISNSQSSSVELVMKLLQNRGREITAFINKDSPFINDFLESGFKIVLLENSLYTSESLLKLYVLLLEFNCVLYDHDSIVGTFASRLVFKMEINTTPRFFPTSEYGHSPFNSKLTGNFNKLSYSLIRFFDNSKKEELKHLIKELPTSKNTRHQIPALYAISNTLLAKPKDYPINSYFTGLWINTKSITGLNLFDRTNKKLLVILNTESSASDAQFLQWCSEICVPLNVQLIVINNNKNVAAIHYLVGDGIIFLNELAGKLIPFVDAVLQMEDCQISMECLYYGKPSLVYTTREIHSLDSRFWKELAYTNGCSIKPFKINKATKQQLSEKIKILMNEKLMLYSQCLDISYKLKREDGVKKAADLIELYFSPSFHLTKEFVY